MKNILILGNNSTKFNELAARLESDDTKISLCSYRDLCFWLDGENTAITCGPDGEDVKNFAKILVLSTSPKHLENYLFSALSLYCDKYGVEMLDNTFSNTDGKLFALTKFWADDIAIARTAYGPADFLVQKLAELGGSGILKSINGTKGKDSYFPHSETELRSILTENPDVHFVLQNFIPNSGDFRIIVINFEPKLAIYRSANGKDFRNNTSLGGEAQLIPLSEIDPVVLDLAVRAAKSLDIKIAGADIIKDDETGEFSVLEVNRTPQLASGAFTLEKAQVLSDLIRS